MNIHLTLLPSGRAVITVESDITPVMVDQLRKAWQEFAARPDGMLIMQGLVERADSVELVLDGERLEVV
jgi:hypothetical protein